MLFYSVSDLLLLMDRHQERKDISALTSWTAAVFWGSG